MSDNAGRDERCGYVSGPRAGNDDETCGLPVLRNGLCLAHCHDRTPEEDKLFEEHIAAKLEAGDCNFRGYVFHGSFSFRKGEPGFNGYCFPEGQAVDFTRAVFKGAARFVFVEIDGDAWFRRSVIHEDARFGGAKVGGDVWLDSAQIHGSAWFTNAQIAGDASSDWLKISGHATFENAQIGGHATFSGAQIGGDARFDGAQIGGDAWLNMAQIGHDTSFLLAKIKGNATFEQTQIGGHATFERTQFGGDARFDGVQVGGIASFSGTRIPSGSGETAYRLAKQTYQRAGDYLTAGDYFYKERCDAWASKLPGLDALWWRYMTCRGAVSWMKKRWRRPGFLRRCRARYKAFQRLKTTARWDRRAEARKREEPPGLWRRLRPWLNPLTWLEFFFGRLFFGYGEKPARMVGWALVLVVFFALQFFWSGEVRNDAGHALGSFWQAIYFSVVTFTTLGFGDFHPTTELARIYAGIEAFAGALFIALFAVTLVKRYGRG